VGTSVLIIAMVFALTFLLELIGLIPEKYGIITKSFRFFGNKEYRSQVLRKYFKK
jgi:UDP-GlcNAc:undecaprenyl-phosphate GlcNAc-1-phosphate transferase